MNNKRIALYIGNALYTKTPAITKTIQTLQNSPLTSPILGLLNKNANNSSQLVYNDGNNPVFNDSGDYVGNPNWHKYLTQLKTGGHIQELYLSFSTNGCQWMSDLINTNKTAAIKILSYIKNNLGFNGIDLDYEGGNLSITSPIYSIGTAAATVGLKITAAPYSNKIDWKNWVNYVQNTGGIVSWLNLQCYAGGKFNNPGDWLDINTSIVAGTCNNCCCPQTNCSPSDMENLFNLWVTGQNSVTHKCWQGTPNTTPQNIGGGFIWVYSSIEGPNFLNYMNAVKNGLGIKFNTEIYI